MVIVYFRLCRIEYTSPWAVFELTTLVVIGTDLTGRWKSNYHEAVLLFVVWDISDVFDTYPYLSVLRKGRRGRVRMVAGFVTTYGISTYHQ